MSENGKKAKIGTGRAKNYFDPRRASFVTWARSNTRGGCYFSSLRERKE